MSKQLFSGSLEDVAKTENRPIRERIEAGVGDAALIALRLDLARFAAETLGKCGQELHLMGHIVGPDRKAGLSPFKHGSDEAVAVSTLLRIASQLVSASADLFHDGRCYAAAALLRQIVEIEYLAWAFETRNWDGERWLRSNKQQRKQIFTPRNLRNASDGKFRDQDYDYHCEFGGHPVPASGLLLAGGPEVSQLLMSDLLGHVGRIWDHFVEWARENSHGTPLLDRAGGTSGRFAVWKQADPLTNLPPP